MMKRYMPRTLLAGFLAAGALSMAHAGPESEVTTKQLKQAMERLRPLHEKIHPPGPSDWLARHEERGETFDRYVRSRPVTPRGELRILYIQPIGTFTKTQQKIVNRTSEYMERYFHLEVRTNEPIPLASIPNSARRTHPLWGDEQVLTRYLLDHVLMPILPSDAAAMIALTPVDLWPGEGWNFVFGQASIRKRVGVWSIYRNGDPDRDEASFRLCLMRTIKTAVHETGHMFSMHHCIAYECCMCGSNHREESDRRPVFLCPECVAKVCWATQVDPEERYERLVEFWERNGFEEERRFCEESIRRLVE